MMPMASLGSTASMPQQLTRINTDGFFVKVWGIVEKDKVDFIRDMIEVYTPKLADGFGQLRSLQELIPGKVVLAFYNNQFQRAEIVQLDGNQTRKVVVNLIDLGILTSIDVNEIRLADTIFGAIPRTGLADDFILHGVVARKQWTSQEVEAANLCLRHCTEISLAGVVGDKKIIQVVISTNGQARINLTTFLIEGGLAEAVSDDNLTNLLRSKYGKTNVPAANQFNVPPPSIPNVPIPSSFAIPGQNQIRGPSIAPVYPNDTSQTTVPPTYQRIRVPKPVPTVQSVGQVHSYVYSSLPADSTHDVVVSHVIDGMNAFTIQLKTCTDVDLPRLMARINDIRPVPITEQIGPGALCLGRFVQDNSLCRAVVSNVLADGASLYFVDFGNTEIVPFNEIYRIPPEFFQEPTMALRFALADLTSALSTAEAHSIFTQLVLQEDLVFKLKVVKPLVPTQQRCELFIVANGKTINIKNKILDKVKLMKPVEYKKLTFKKNQIADVTVTFSESLSRFFVQLELNQAILEIIMKGVEEYCLHSENKDILFTEDIVENMAVCAPYEDDTYYRGLIVDEPDNEGNIAVFYVDYGNSETVHYSKLRIMNNEMMSQFPTQAIECRLDFDQSLNNNEEVTNKFIEMVDGENFKMAVKNILPGNVLLVDLVDQNGLNVADNLKEMFGAKSPSGYAAPPKPPLQKSASGNWRDKNSSSMEGDFSSFRDERTRPDNRDERSRTDSNSNQFRPSHDDRGRGRNFESKRRDSDGVDTTDESRNQTSDYGESWRHDKFNNDQSNDRYGGARDRNDTGRGSYRKRDDDSGTWNSRNQDENRAGGGERRFDKGGEGGRSREWGNKTDDEFGGGRPRRDGGFRGRREEGGDDFGSRPPRREDGFNDRPRRDNRSNDGGFVDRPPRRDGGFNDRPPRRDNRSNDGGFGNGNGWDNKNSDSWDSKPKTNDSWDNKPKTNDSWDNKPKNDSWDNKSGNNAWDNNEKTNDSGWGSSQDNRGGRRDFGGGFGDDNRGRRGGGFRNRDDNFNSDRGPKKWGDDSGSSAVTLLDGFDKGAKIADPEYQPGHQVDSVISWFVNPINFYLMPSDNADFKNLMEQVQSEYPTRKTLNTNELSPNDHVVARDKDNVIYRATVLRTSPRGVVVTFVDYGNTETVGKSQVWAINPDHCVIPKQAILCSLHNIASNDENGVWKSTSEYDNYFGKDSFKATLVEGLEQDGLFTWSVNLIDPEGQDVADQLVANNLALRKVVLASEELYDLDLLLNQTISVFTGALTSSKKFFVHIEPDKADHIGTYIQGLTEKPENLITLPEESIVDGGFCLAPSSDDAYYRALILSVNSLEKQAHVAFIDYGDETDVSFDVLKVLPDYLKTYNAQAVECSLYDSDSFTNDEDFIQNMEEKDFIIKVMSVQNKVLHVKLFDVKGAALPYPAESDETVPVVCPAPVLRLFENVVVSSVTSEKTFLQRPSDQHVVNELNNRLFEKYENDVDQEKAEVEEGKFYVAKSGQFEAWYRCQLLEPGSDKIFYIDYGNTEPIEGLLSIRPLDEEFYNVPACCFPVSTDVSITAESNETLMTSVQEIVFKAVLKNTSIEGASNVEFFAELRTEAGKTFADHVIELNSGSKLTIEPEPSYNAFENWKPNESKNVVLSAFSSPIEFYLLLRDDAGKLAQLQDDLENSLKTVLPLVGSTDMLCAAKSTDDNKWYRCYQADNVAVDCRLVIQPSEYKKLPAKFAFNRDKYVVKCRLDVASPTSDWQQETVDHFSSLVKRENELVAKLEAVKDGKMIVDLTSNGTSIAELLINEGLVKYQGHDVFISHAVSLTEFYIQDESQQDDLFELLDKLKEGEDAWETIIPEQGQIVAAKFPEDEQWYRAEIISIVDTEITVLFIDYGNQSVCTEFRVLPDELSQLPRFASRCSAYPLPENAEELKDKFVAFVEQQTEKLFKVYFLNRHSETVLVMLYFAEEDIEKALTEKVEPESELPPQGPSLEFKTVSVVHINSPSSFYVQTETPLLDEVADRLDEVEQSEQALNDGMIMGKLYAAKFAEDGVWYRAKAIAANEVLFIDFGNTAVVEEVRNLPEDLKKIPILAKHCAFKSPVGLEEWPQVATERFSELTCNGDAVFAMDIVEEGDPAYVQMIDNGVNVTDELYTLCQAELTAPSNENNKPTVIISFADNLNEIWIQDQTPALDELCEELSNVETFDALETSAVEPDAIVAALFDEDEVWYRAKVLEKLDDGCKVLFIDYGNESNVTQIKSLPEDLAGMPAFATKCRLAGLPEDAATSWPSTVLDKLNEISESAESFVVLNKEVKDDVTYVSLQYDGATELSQQLIEFHSQTDAQPDQPETNAIEEASNLLPTPEIDQDQDQDKAETSPNADETVPESATDLDPLENESSNENSCVVTEATSESEFHLQNDATKVKMIQDSIQSNDESNEIESVENAAESNKIEPVVGEIVSALDEEHNTAYKSKINSIDENKESCHVTRIDDITNVELFIDGVSVMDILMPSSDASAESSTDVTEPATEQVDVDAADGAVVSVVRQAILPKKIVKKGVEVIELKDISVIESSSENQSSVPSSSLVVEESINSEDISGTENPENVEPSSSVNEEIVRTEVPSLLSIEEKEVESGTVLETVVSNDFDTNINETSDSSLENNVNQSNTFDIVESCEKVSDDFVMDDEKVCSSESTREVIDTVMEFEPKSEDIEVNDTAVEKTTDTLIVCEIESTDDEKMIMEDDNVPHDHVEPSPADSIVSKIDETVPEATSADSNVVKIEATIVHEEITADKDDIIGDRKPPASEIISPEPQSDDVKCEDETASAETSVEAVPCEVQLSTPELNIPEDLKTDVNPAESHFEDETSTGLINDQISTNECIVSEKTSESCKVAISIPETDVSKDLETEVKPADDVVAPELETSSNLDDENSVDLINEPILTNDIIASETASTEPRIEAESCKVEISIPELNVIEDLETNEKPSDDATVTELETSPSIQNGKSIDVIDEQILKSDRIDSETTSARTPIETESCKDEISKPKSKVSEDFETDSKPANDNVPSELGNSPNLEDEKSTEPTDDQISTSDRIACEAQSCKVEISKPKSKVSEDFETDSKPADDNVPSELGNSPNLEDEKSTKPTDDQISTSDRIACEAQSCKVEISKPKSKVSEDFETDSKPADDNVPSELGNSPNLEDEKSTEPTDDQISTSDRIACEAQSCKVEISKPESNVSEDLENDSKPTDDNAPSKLENSTNVEDEKTIELLDDQLPMSDRIASETSTETPIEAEPCKVEILIGESNVSEDLEKDEKPSDNASNSKTSSDSVNIENSSTNESIPIDKVIVREQQTTSIETYGSEIVENVKIDDFDGIANLKGDSSSESTSDYDNVRATFSTPEANESVESKDAVIEEVGSDYSCSSNMVTSSEMKSTGSPALTLIGSDGDREQIDDDDSDGEASEINENIATIDKNTEEGSHPGAGVAYDSPEPFEFDRSPDVAESVYFSFDEGAMNDSYDSSDDEAKLESFLLDVHFKCKNQAPPKPPKQRRPKFSRYLTVGKGPVRELVDGDEYTVTCVYSPGKFYVQRVSDVKFVQNMQKHLEAASVNNPPVVEPQLNTMYTAAMGNTWFRVNLIDSDSFHGYRLFCVDFGKVIFAKEMYELPKEMLAIAPFATCCGLPSPTFSKKWPSEVATRFEEMTLLGNPTFKLKLVIPATEEKNIHMIKLTNYRYDVCEEIDKKFNEFDGPPYDSDEDDEYPYASPDVSTDASRDVSPTSRLETPPKFNS